MPKIILLIAGVFASVIFSYSQISGNKLLFIIDSIPIINDPEDWNQIKQGDIAYINVIKNTDSLNLLGWGQMDAITYIFTKAYSSRPDSIKKIPSLRQMIFRNEVWTFRDTVYSGRYIDYFNNGSIENEGTLLNGRLNGALTVFFKNGNKKSVSNYKDGELFGNWTDYYNNGMVMRTTEYEYGKVITGTWKNYFINGRLQQEMRLKNATHHDTSVTYYSTGKIKAMQFSINGVFYHDKKQNDLNYYTIMFNQSINSKDIKAANKNFYHLWLLDSTSSDTYFFEGLLLYCEFRFDRAIESFDKALATEPLMKEALKYRALSRLKKYKFQHARQSEKDIDLPVTSEDIEVIPGEEMTKICSDIMLANEMDNNAAYMDKTMPEFLLNFCLGKEINK